MKRGLVVLAILVGLVGVPLAYALVADETPVLFSRKNERNPAADWNGSDEVLVFTRSRTGYPNRYDAYAKEGTNPSIKLNERGQGWTGGVDYPVVAYQQIYAGESDIYLYDLAGGTRMAAETNATADRWEWHPTIQGTTSDYWILFGQDNNSTPTQRVMLLHHTNTGTHDLRLLSRIDKASYYLQPDQVHGDYATYTRCTPICNVVRYHIPDGLKVVLPKPVTSRPRHQYAGAVTSAGVVYLVRSGPSCGEKVKIVRYELGDPTYGTVLAQLPTGFDIATAFARENPDTSVDVFYDRVNCNTGRFDIYKIAD